MRARRPIRRPIARARARRGFSLVEILVAVVILSIGVLGLVAGSTVVVRMMGEGMTTTVASSTIQTRMERIAGQRCDSLKLGVKDSLIRPNVRERWIISDAGNNTRKINDTITWITQRGNRSLGYVTIIPCRPGI